MHREKERRRRKPPKGAHSNNNNKGNVRAEDCATHSRNRIFPREKSAQARRPLTFALLLSLILLLLLFCLPFSTHTHSNYSALLMYLFVFSRLFVMLRMLAMAVPRNRMWYPWWSNSSHSPFMRIIAIRRYIFPAESPWSLLPKRKIYDLTPASCKCYLWYLSIYPIHIPISTCSFHRDQLIKHDFESSPMSVADILSPMSVDRSMAENSQISNDQVSIIDKDASVVSELEMAPLPRNDRQRFFEVVQYQHDILKNFRESEVSYKSRTTDYWMLIAFRNIYTLAEGI